ncbi:MAG: S8 family serine peptidase [Flavobacteriales bacterium]|nr:S8 family serine peptidase [Flavobacteriales bacterium]
MRLLLLLLVISPFLGISQKAKIEHLNVQTKLLVNQMDDEQTVTIFIRGDVELIQDYLNPFNRKIKGQLKNLILAEISISEIKFLAQQPFIEGFEFEWGHKKLLGDSILIKNRALAAHSGQFPLPKSYKGKDVIAGLIDTGIALEHMDFRNTDSSTRILNIWDQNLPYDASLTPVYGYGQAFDSSHINAGTCVHYDANGHGSGVAGIMSGNGTHSNKYTGIAPESDIIAVALDFSGANLTASVDAFKYIYDLSETYNKSCVINASYGDYLGSHDGLDATALFLDSLLNEKSGRLFVAAAGNSGAFGPYHLRHSVTGTDTNFTWFQPNFASTASPTVFLDIWADTSNMSNLNFSIGADHNVSFAHGGHLNFRNIVADGLVGTTVMDSIMSGGNKLADVSIYTELRGGQYNLQVLLPSIDSTNFNYSLISSGEGSFDLWSLEVFGVAVGSDVIWYSNMINTGLPAVGTWPEMSNYVLPDSAQSVVSGFQCHENVVTVGDYIQASGYTDFLGDWQACDELTDSIASHSSRGPNRLNLIKPDVTATGRWLLGSLPVAKSIIVQGGAQAYKLSQTGFHLKRSGTSFSAPCVAGIGALLLEKCPSITQQDFLALLQNTSFEDGFTGTTPNNQWGYGKPDAFALLNETNVLPVLLGDTAFCAGQSTTLTTDNSYVIYDWNGVSSSASFIIDSSYSGYVLVQDVHGCKSDSVWYNITEHAWPTTPLITNWGGGILSTEQADSIQWHVDGLAVNGENDTIFSAPNNQWIFVEHIDSNGCSSFSDSLFLTVSAVAENGFQYKMYPNPATELLVIEASMKMDQIVVSDINGRIIIRKTVSDLKTELSLSHIAPSIYSLTIYADQAITTTKFQVIK